MQRVLRTILNQLPARYGYYATQGNKIHRTFSNGFSYIASECKSPEEAQRITKQLNQVAQS
jgi:hypothetical protein